MFAPVAALTWDVDADAIPYIAGSAAIELVYFGLLATAYARAGVTFVYPVARGSAPVLVLVVSVVALGVALSAGQVAGVLAIAAGVLLVRGVGHGDGRALALALGVGACIAGYTLVDDHGLRYADALPYFEAVLVLDGDPVRGGHRRPLRPGGAAGCRRPEDDPRRDRHVRRLRAHARRARARRGRARRGAAGDERGHGGARPRCCSGASGRRRGR